MNRQLLEQLIYFKKYGTLADVADKLLITQPTVTRGMQKLEDKLCVKLFKRSVNKLTLTKTGELAAEEAKKLLEAEDNFIKKIQQFEKDNSILNISCTEPGPRYILPSINFTQKCSLSTKNIETVNVIDSLLNFDYDFIISSEEIHTDDVESLYIGTEQLLVNIDAHSIDNTKKQISFDELNSMSFIVLDNIGIWSNIIKENIPHAKFLYQKDYESFSEILANSNFPYFSTNFVSSNAANQIQRRIPLIITDDNARLDFYVVYLKQNKKKLSINTKLIQEKFSKLN